MVLIEEILQLPKEQQLAIVEAIQDNLDGFGEEDEGEIELSDEHIAFIEERVRRIESTNQRTYTWEEVKESLKNRSS